jgi:hypothetical protein
MMLSCLKSSDGSTYTVSRVIGSSSNHSNQPVAVLSRRRLNNTIVHTSCCYWNHVMIIIVVLETMLLMLSSVNVVHASSEIYQVDGSGITDVQECFWDMMHQMEASASVPIRLSYRALPDTFRSGQRITGTQYAQEEFMQSMLAKILLANPNAPNITNLKSVSMFIAVDNPMPSDLYGQQFKLPGIDDQANTQSQYLQIPILASPIGFFHSVPQSKVYDIDNDNDDAELVWNSSTTTTNGRENQDDILSPDEADSINDIESIYEDQSALELYIDACTISKLYFGKITLWDDVLNNMPDQTIMYGANKPKSREQNIRPIALRGKSAATFAITTVCFIFVIFFVV